MQIARLTNPVAFLNPEIDALYSRASLECIIDPGNYQRAKDEYPALTLDPYMLLMIGRDEEAWVACSLTMLPKCKLFLPQQAIMHCEGSLALRRAICRSSADFIRAAGYNRCQTANASGIEDDVWLRLNGLKGKALGSFIEVDLT